MKQRTSTPKGLQINFLTVPQSLCNTETLGLYKCFRGTPLVRQVYRYKESNRVNLSNLSNLYNLSIKRVALWYETPKPATLEFVKMAKRVACNILLEVVVSGANKTY